MTVGTRFERERGQGSRQQKQQKRKNNTYVKDSNETNTVGTRILAASAATKEEVEIARQRMKDGSKPVVTENAHTDQNRLRNTKNRHTYRMTTTHWKCCTEVEVRPSRKRSRTSKSGTQILSSSMTKRNTERRSGSRYNGMTAPSS